MKNLKKINEELTKLIIMMHDQGFSEDFYYDNQDQIVNYQHNEHFLIAEVNINFLGKFADKISKTMKFIYTVITHCGTQGLLFTDNQVDDLSLTKSFGTSVQLLESQAKSDPHILTRLVHAGHQNFIYL